VRNFFFFGDLGKTFQRRHLGRWPVSSVLGKFVMSSIMGAPQLIIESAF
jgi:hypothetical protein